MLAALLQEIREERRIFKESLEKSSQELRESLEKGLQEREEIVRNFGKSLKEDLQESLERNSQETREREERLHKSIDLIEKNFQEFRESLESGKEAIVQEIRTSYTKTECNLRKEIQELPKRLKMNVDERESKLQKNVNQMQGDVEKTEGKLTEKIEEDVEENRTQLGGKITEVTQMQKQCNNVVEGIGEKQKQLAVNLKNAIAVQREEDDQWGAIKVQLRYADVKKYL
ncbi:mRNA export factor GLE1-like [Schistocerca nitens]|uniref:mRNA export factor GLE1-like n=1 Tax=Schistocerca nitens TaxID=7011 RepID=UPI00211933D8|nr:mRNA export factor GLE1-like [Schistocerca nitens]